jgi:hypothetical protein
VPLSVRGGGQTLVRQVLDQLDESGHLLLVVDLRTLGFDLSKGLRTCLGVAVVLGLKAKEFGRVAVATILIEVVGGVGGGAEGSGETMATP